MSRDLTGKALKLIRVQKGLTQKDVAQALGVSNKFISLIETGVRCIPPRRKGAYLEILGTNESDLRLFMEIVEKGGNK